MNAPLSTDLGVIENTITVLETASAPRPPDVRKTYTFDELREIFDPEDTIPLLLDEIDRLRRVMQDQAGVLNRSRMEIEHALWPKSGMAKS